MIARMWKARATADGARQYVAYFQVAIVPKLALIDGYKGATLFARTDGNGVEVTVLTRWDSIVAIRAFTGESIEAAVVDGPAMGILMDFDRSVTHHEIVFEG